MEQLELHLVKMPWLLGDDWALGVERLDTHPPMKYLITRQPMPLSRPLVIEPQPPRPLLATA